LEVFQGTWKQWQMERLQAVTKDSPEKGEAAPTAAEEEWERQRAARRQRRQAERQEEAVAETEERITGLESRLNEIEQLMAQASAAQDLGRLRTLQDQHRAVSQRLEKLMDEWAARAA
jgi:molecular chaperone GrpE (heat shock protein)